MRSLRAGVAASCLFLAGCETVVISDQQEQLPPADPATTQLQIDDSFESAAKTSEASGDYLAAAGYWQSLLDREPTNIEASVGLAENLRRLGQYAYATDVLRSALTHNADDPALLSLYGRTLVQSGDAADAVEPLQSAATQDATSWETFAALGVAYGMLDEPEKAGEANLRALALSPGNPKVLNNMGLEAAMDGNLDAGIDFLERAAQHEEADVTVRQNLALLLAYRGDLSRAEQLTRQDLPQDMADRNIAFYRSLSDDEAASLQDLVNQSQLSIEQEQIAAPQPDIEALALNEPGQITATNVQVVVPEEEVVEPAGEIVGAVDSETAMGIDSETYGLEATTNAPMSESQPAQGSDAALPPTAVSRVTETSTEPSPTTVTTTPASEDDGALAPERITQQTEEVSVEEQSLQDSGATSSEDPLGNSILKMIGSISTPVPEPGVPAGDDGGGASTW